MRSSPVLHRVGADGVLVEEHGSPVPGRPSMVLVPALGVRIGYYRPLVESWTAHGRHLLAVETRGAGWAAGRLRGSGFGYADLLADLSAVTSMPEAGGAPVVVGHSLGGQLAVLGAAAGLIAPSTVVAVATGTSSVPASRPPLARVRRRAAILTVLAVSGALGYWPGHRLGFAGRQPHALMREWAHEALHGRYPADLESVLPRLRRRAVLLAIRGDPLVPPWAVEHLAARLPGSVETGVVTAGAADHFLWARRDPHLVVEAIEARLAGGGER